MGPNRVPYVVTHDGRTIRYPDSSLAVNDTIKYDLKNNTVVDTCRFEMGNVAYIISGNNIGRVGVITAVDKH